VKLYRTTEISKALYSLYCQNVWPIVLSVYKPEDAIMIVAVKGFNTAGQSHCYSYHRNACNNRIVKKIVILYISQHIKLTETLKSPSVKVFIEILALANVIYLFTYF